MKNDIAFRISHMIKMSRSNRVRTLLTGAGIFTAVFLLAVGIIITESIYNTRFEIINASDGKTLIASEIEDIKILSNYACESLGGSAVTDISLPVAKPIYTVPLDGQRYLILNTKFHGIDGESPVLPAEDGGIVYGMAAELAEGRMPGFFELSGNAAVAVIDEMTADILFGGESALGKTIEITNDYGGGSVGFEDAAPMHATELTVIGVMKNNAIGEKRERMLRESVRSGNTNVFLTVDVYCPAGFLHDNFGDLKTKTLFTFDDSEAFETFLGAVGNLAASAERRGERLDYTTRSILADELSADLSDIKTLLDIVVGVLCFISGISIMSIIFFSVKERISEIGIRKAFGATRSDIVFQFVSEVVMIALAASAAAVSVAFYACAAAQGYLASKLLISLEISLPLYKLLIPISVGILEAMLCSSIPALYAANIKVTDALRFE